MRRILAIFLMLAIAFEVVAQTPSSRNSIELDLQSFRPEQKGTLKEVNIDPIGIDRSKRKCARLKIRLNRMSREEIAALEVRLPGGLVELMKRNVAAEGNGLILELTAKPQTRLYLHHEKFGDSNEVTLNLEGDKVYLLDGQLNMLIPVTISSNVRGADVYLDGVFKKKIGENYMCAIADVLPGAHTVKLVHGASSVERVVDVNSENFSFRVEVNTATSRPQYVVFNLEPKGATVFVDGKPLTTGATGVAQTVLQNGTYSWRAIANGYHEQSGTFTVSGEKIVKNVKLDIDAAMVTISSGDGAEIWVNNELKGVSPWRGQLFSGTYIFEARKAGHRTTTLAQTITSTQPEQSYTIEAPTPIMGTLNISSEPAMADVYVDGKVVGQTPMFTDLMEGEHTVELRLGGYLTHTKTITIEEGKVKVAAVEMILLPKYKVGDYYNENGKEGVIFWVDETGQHGKIVSLTESSSALPWSWDTAEQKRFIGADDHGDGAKNMAIVKQITDWKSKYSAFKWCADLGEGWYLPAIDELKIFTLDNTVHDAVNRTLETKGKKLANMGDYRWYWSSTESDSKNSLDKFCAWGVGVYDGLTYNFSKNSDYYVRAVAAVTFGESESKTTSPASATYASQVASSKTYKVGDYYNENGKKGVVFWVTDGGKHGKIVSLTESSSEVDWSSNKKEQKRLIGADDKDDGAKNMAIVKQIRDWESKYPAFKWCTDLGEGWYLPAIDELKIFTLDNTVHDAVNQTLETKGKKLANKGDWVWYWSSTEYNYKTRSGYFCACYVNMYDGGTGYGGNKYHNNYVRAVSAF